jgi:glucosyl-3-phosphoglycerate synthase
VAYLSRIIFGLDRATEEEAFQLRDLIKATGLKNYLIQWNDGPGFSSIYRKLNEGGFNIPARARTCSSASASQSPWERSRSG